MRVCFILCINKHLCQPCICLNIHSFVQPTPKSSNWQKSSTKKLVPHSITKSSSLGSSIVCLLIYHLSLPSVYHLSLFLKHTHTHIHTQNLYLHNDVSEFLNKAYVTSQDRLGSVAVTNKSQ